MPSASTSRRRRSSSAASVLHPPQTNNIRSAPTPPRSPKPLTQRQRKSEVDPENNTTRRHQRKVSFAEPPLTNAQLSETFYPFRSTPPTTHIQPVPASQTCVQILPFPNGPLPHCVALIERDVLGTLSPGHFYPPPAAPPQSQTYQISLCNSEADRRSSGYGMFASRSIPRGGVILVERPVLVVSTGEVSSCGSIGELLDSKVKNAVMQMADTHSRGGVSLEGIVRTNALEFELSLGMGRGARKLLGLFMDMARVNHSCGPNALWQWDPASFSLRLEAVRPIPAGCEITIPYVDCLQPRAERRRLLKSLYHFDCYCQHCDIHWSEPGASMNSDFNRKELLDFWERTPSFDEWSNNRQMADDVIIRAHLAALKMRATEGVEMFAYKKHMDAIAMCFGALEDRANFVMWTERSRNAKEEVGERDMLRVMDSWIQDPRRFPMWGFRRPSWGRGRAL